MRLRPEGGRDNPGFPRLHHWLIAAADGDVVVGSIVLLLLNIALALLCYALLKRGWKLKA